MSNYFLKAFKFIYGLILYLCYTRKLDFNSVIKNKRVAIIGAANSAYNTGKGGFIDGFDIVIRINKAPHLLKEEKWSVDIGRKADVLFHSFYENNLSGGGPLDISLYDKLGIRYVINPVASYAGHRVIFNFFKKYLKKRIVYSFPTKPYKEMLGHLEGFYPTIGSCALKASIDSNFSELYITGFTFFKTAFGEGYRNEIKEAHQVQKFIKDSGQHNPDLEFLYFLKLLDKNKHKNILLDSVLRDIVHHHSSK
jgi:hypothetical protein